MAPSGEVVGISNSSTCYYPNGDTSSDGDIPCSDSSSGVACCPKDWTCQNNGLCYLANQGYLGRYTCTDSSWGNGCPQICTYDNTASGNEAVLECDQNSFCCDTNRPDLTNPNKACCDTSNSRFSLDSRQSELPQGSSPTSAGIVFSSGGTTSIPPPSSSSPAASSSLSAQSVSTNVPSSNTKSPSVSVITSVINHNSISTFVSTASASAAPGSTTGPSPVPPNPPASKNLGAIIGPAVAVPLALLAIALAAFFCLRRRRRRSPQPEPPAYPAGYGAEPMYKGMISPNSPYSPANKSELEGSSPDLSSHSPATAQTEHSKFDSPRFLSSWISTNASSAGVRGSSRLSQMSSVDQPRLVEAPAAPVDSAGSTKGPAELPEKGL